MACSVGACAGEGEGSRHERVAFLESPSGLETESLRARAVTGTKREFSLGKVEHGRIDLMLCGALDPSRERRQSRLQQDLR